MEPTESGGERILIGTLLAIHTQQEQIPAKRQENRRLMDAHPVDESQYTPYFEIELFSDGVAGHATSYAARGRLTPGCPLPATLADDPSFLKWIQDEGAEYPLTVVSWSLMEFIRCRLAAVGEVDPNIRTID
jgi:hypothetical protein